MFDVFGAEMPLAVRFFLAFLIVLGLIGVTAWAVRRFGSGQLGGAVRGRQPRLAVIDYANVDARRRLILVRRDNVEHLLMIGGPTDVVVEPNIVRATPAARDVALARPPAAAEPLPRVIPLPEAASNGSWPLQPEPLGPSGPPAPPAPPPMPPRRAPRVEPPRVEPQQLEPAQEEEPRIPSPPPLAESPSRPQREALAALAEDLAANPAPSPPPLPRSRAGGPPRPQPIEPRGEARPEPRVEARIEPRSEPRLPDAPAEAEATAAADQNLAEMAQRLEAALRKPKAAEPREAPPPLAAPPLAAPPLPAAPTASAPEPNAEQEDVAMAPPAPPPVPPPAPTPPPLPPRAARPAPVPPRPAAKPKEGKAVYDTLEQEMASLLGRPPGKTN